jgi:SAM-dependent methyltransferase
MGPVNCDARADSMQIQISDDAWFEAVAHPEAAGDRFGFRLPSMPPPEVQKHYNAIHGIATLEHAFAIYRCFRARLPAGGADPMIMDFGAGWGRVARFFLRDTAPGHLWAVDPNPLSHEWLRKTGLPCRIVESDSWPPIPDAPQGRFDLIYANSVFSHLSERLFNAWIPHLLSLLRPGGRLVFTSRGLAFIDRMEKQSRQPGWRQGRIFGDLRLLRSQYEAGEFVFRRTRKRNVVPSGRDFGHALVPKDYFERRYPGCLVEFREHVPGMSQTLFVAASPSLIP